MRKHMKENNHCILLYQMLSVIVSFLIFSNEKQVILKNRTQQQFVISNRILIVLPLSLLLTTQTLSLDPKCVTPN